MKNKINIIFDFDGVILDSNEVKTNAFKNISSRFGLNASLQLVNFHKKNGGISRFKKIEWFMESVLKSNDNNLKNNLIDEYGKEVMKSLLDCKLRTNLDNLKKKLKDSKWAIASGGFENEIKFFLHEKNLIKNFELGVFGSPTPKIDILKNIKIKNNNEKKIKWFMVGDSLYDYECSKNNNINFIFAYEWSEIEIPKSFLNDKSILIIKGIEKLNIKELINLS